MKIRQALPEDAAAICHVQKTSVLALCAGDHHNDPAILKRWLGNKTPETIVSWMNDPEASMFVAVEGDEILAVGSVMNSGEITLNYVLPKARFRGISRSMIKMLEEWATQRGATTLTLSSTGTARRFYVAQGYAEQKVKMGPFGTMTYPMVKAVTPASHEGR
ncbi:MAG TPA: GNAT family N-acetyltransferase [Rhodospirillaceae bacterium]|nr:GNAT family N-acetyltransferase [Rhodospirillaceae bacterium]